MTDTCPTCKGTGRVNVLTLFSFVGYTHTKACPSCGPRLGRKMAAKKRKLDLARTKRENK